MKILITGATGFLGGWVLEKLQMEFGYNQVVGTGRNQSRADELIKQGYNILIGDLKDPDFVKNSFSNITHIVHCAAKSSPWGTYDSFYEDNVQTTINLLEKILTIEKFIYISTPSVYFNFNDRLNIKESDPLPKKFVNHYATTKYLAEQKVLNFDKPDMMRVIIRPRAIVGARDTVIIPRVIRAYEAGRLKIIGNGKNICDFSSVKNIAQAVFLALTTENNINKKVFNITDDQPVALWPLLQSTLSKLGFSAKLKKINYKLVFTVAAISEFMSKYFSKKEPVLSRYGIGVLKYSLTLDITEAKKHLKYKPIVTTEKSIDEFVYYYHEQKGSNSD
ncbi:MAG: NAD-dependent epimerase/dehydratase family protein [Bacteroidetes bacterium]|nr:NAD-dependent epimerase/dehydratase family protein [Bacteroidota bacterium]MBT5528488.1 NAD-dependent epimerase/dehydratase family protein [Cytophagia bacterium]MBT3800673.1 NAD-dependent epimerase/dehydratase family protein [Bacteroidota bacterium]MBT3934427.1 NAD-dependent epimerase/dehydratase family protein [Bacteroidota bacterium]MBT4337696.1 NAD-dependent epimerase/dehydratase family protein [Bacteroidota bacterium]